MLWYVMPAFLSDGLLFRQHQSLHAVSAGIVAGKPRRGVTRFLRYGGFIAWLHKLTIDEMTIRGARHQTPMMKDWVRIPVERRRFDYPLRPEYIHRDITKLKAKLRSPNTRGIANNSRLPLAAAGLQLLEAQKVIVLENRLPPLALEL